MKIERNIQGVPVLTSKDLTTPQSLLKAVKEFNTKPHTPDLITKTFQTIWTVRSEELKKQGVYVEFALLHCPYTQKKIQQLEKEGKRTGLRLLENNPSLLATLWPGMDVDINEGELEAINNKTVVLDWFNYENSIDAPHLNTTEEQLKQEFEKQGRQMLDITNDYLIAAQDSKLITDYYLGEVSTFTRGLYNGHVVSARFVPDGQLRVFSFLRPGSCGPILGGRSREGLIKKLKTLPT